MCKAGHRQWGQRGGRAFFPELTPPPLNYAVVTGKLVSDPREGRGPSGDPVTLLEIEFPVAHPEHPRFLWAYATYDLEVPSDVGGRDFEEMRKGAPALVWGQLSERLAIEGRRTSRRPVILAAQIKPGPTSSPQEIAE
jgi:hypothetical protein